MRGAGARLSVSGAESGVSLMYSIRARKDPAGAAGRSNH